MKEYRIGEGAMDTYFGKENDCKLYMLKSNDAAIALGEATARAVQQIPDAHCNGDMHAALDYAQQVKHEKKDFLNGQALHIISDNSVSGDGVRRTYD